VIDDRELWACANTVQIHHGENAMAFVASRISALASAGDEPGVETWQSIGKKLAQLTLAAQPLN
jgi:hypothetical protein